MIFHLHIIDALIISTITLAKCSVGLITGMVIPIFPTLISLHFKESIPFDSNFNTSVSTIIPKSSFNYQQLSILFATKNLGQIVTSPLMGYLCGVIGSLNVLSLGILCQIFTVLFYGLGNQYYLLILGRLFEAIANGAINCAVSSFIAYQYKDHKQRGFIYGIGGLGLCIGGAAGPAYGGFIFQYYGKVVVFLSVLSIMILEAILVLWLLISLRNIKKKKNEEIEKSLCLNIKTEKKSSLITDFSDNEDNNNLTKLSELIMINDDNNNINDKEDNENIKVKDTLLNSDKEESMEVIIEKSPNYKKHNMFTFLFDPYFIISLGAFPVSFTSLFIYLATLPHYMNQTFDATESQQGAIWLLNLLGYFAGFFVGNFLNTKFSKYRHIVLMVIIYFQAIGAICMALMPTWWSIAIPLCFIVQQHLIFEIVLAPLLATIVEKRHNSAFGPMSGIIMTVIAFTAALGSFLGPILLGKIGFFYINLIILIMGLVYGPFLLFLKKFV